jgi:hypothetical protein
MPYDRRPSTSAEEHTYASRLDLVTRRLVALIRNDDGYSTAVHALLDDAMHLCDHAATWKRDDVDDAVRLLDQAVMVLTAAEERAQGEREVRATSGLRAYTALFAIVSQWSERFDSPVHARAGRAYVDQAKGLIRLAMHTRHEGDIDRAVQYLHRAVTSLRKGKMVEETFGSQLDQLWQWYDVVARGVEPGSEAHECLERFVVAVGVFNDSMARDDTDHIIETFDTAVALLQNAASARPRC